MTRLRCIHAGLFAPVIMVLSACAPRAGGTAPAPMLAEARFVASTPPVVARDPGSDGEQSDSGRCALASRFDGVARARARDLEVVLSHAWVAITRVNDKRWDDLHVSVEALGEPSAPAGALVLPTVDSAGPQLTTWQAPDTVRLLLPLTPGTRPRRLYFRVTYHTVGYTGRFAGCDVMSSSDTLHFAAPGSAP